MVKFEPFGGVLGADNPRGYDIPDSVRRWRRMAAAIAELDTAEFMRRYACLDPEHRPRVLRMRHYFRIDEFLKYCFPDLFFLGWNGYHLWQMRRPKVRFVERGGRSLNAVAAPRGIAKTTLMKGELVHDAVFGFEPFILVMSAGQALAVSHTNHVATLFDPSRKDTPLHRLYGPFTVSGGKMEPVVTCPAWGLDPERGMHMTAYAPRSWGTQVRGINVNGQRPSKIVVDDGERPDRVRNPEQRRIWHQFLNDDVLKAFPKEGGGVLDWRGTVLHTDSILARQLKDAGYQSRRFQSVISWPKRMELWAQCGDIWKDLTLGELPERQAAARAFYEAHRAEMDEGVQVLDDEVEPIFDLFEIIWGEGWPSFLREKQNNPRDPNAQLFDVKSYSRCRWRQHPVHGWVLYPSSREPGGADPIPISRLNLTGYWDPAMGKKAGLPGSGMGDYNAIAVVARDRARRAFLATCWMRRCHPTTAIAAAWTLHDTFGLQRLHMESNGFQALLGGEVWRRTVEERRAQGLSVNMRLVEDVNTESKDMRISSLEPALANDWLQLPDNLDPAVEDQIDGFPTHDHDDGPDAIEGAYRKSGGMPPRRGRNRLPGQ